MYVIMSAASHNIHSSDVDVVFVVGCFNAFTFFDSKRVNSANSVQEGMLSTHLLNIL